MPLSSSNSFSQNKNFHLFPAQHLFYIHQYLLEILQQFVLHKYFYKFYSNVIKLKRNNLLLYNICQKDRALREHRRLYLHTLYIYMLDRNELNYVTNIVEKVINFVVEFKFRFFFPELRGIGLQMRLFTLRQIKATTKNFDATNKIGEGGFGCVFKVF